MEIKDIIKESLFLDQDLPVIDPIIQIQNKTIAYPQNFICINGMPKSFKTTFAFFFIQSAIQQKEVFSIKVNLAIDEKIILIDTEQSLYDFTRQIKNLKSALEVKKMPENFSAYLFRKYEPQQIIKSIYELIQKEKPKIIIIDNLTELVINPNDMIESKAVITFLKQITAEFNLVVICLLHNAKSTMQSIGNIGSMADRSAQSSVLVKHDKETKTTILEPLLMRSDTFFDPISIYFDQEQKRFLQTDTITKDKTSSRKFVLMNLTNEDHNNRLRIIFNKVKFIPYAELIEEIKKLYGIGTNIAKQQVTPYLLGNEFLLSDKGIYQLNLYKK